MKRLSSLTFLALFALISRISLAFAADTSASVAKIGDVTLTEDQMRADLGVQLYQVENQSFMIKRNWVDQKAQDILFNKAAQQAGLSRKDWEAREIDANAGVPNPTMVQQMAGRFARPGVSSTDTLKMASDYISNQNKMSRRNQLFQELAAKTPIEVSLVKPEAPKINVTYAADDPVKGNKNAPVTIVEYTDFQCPYCKRSQDTLKQVEKTYPKDVKLVARQYPLPFHDRAKPASEAALCAKDQGKFWEFRDKLFEKQELSDANFQQYASQVGLNSKKFNACLASHKYAARIESDIAAGQKIGVTGTPAFFVNGEMINGAQPFPAFQSAIDTALKKK